MMTYEEAMKLPIPEKSKDNPNIYRLARIIYSTGRPKQIMAALEVLAAAGALDGLKSADGQKEVSA